MHPVSAAVPDPVTITVAPVNYGDLSRFPSEAALADDICACHEAGASVVHFHVTDSAGHATADTAFFDSVAAGGSVRVGFEDSDELGGGRRARSNAELVRNARDLLKVLDRSVATTVQTRARYGLKQSHAPGPVA